MLTNHFWEAEGYAIKFLPTAGDSGKEEPSKKLKMSKESL